MTIRLKEAFTTKNNLILILLTVAGLFLSIYLFYMYTRPEPVTCIGNSSGCETVRESSYSNFLGIMLPFWGSIYFLGLLGLLLVPLNFDLGKYRNKFLILIFFVILTGFLFETRMTVIQLVLLRSLCVWCFSVWVVVTLLTISAIRFLLEFSKTQ